jgi:hypothetical protein
MPQVLELADADGQSAQWLKNHIGKRHLYIRLVTRGEHDADHRLHPDRLDHTHKEGE